MAAEYDFIEKPNPEGDNSPQPLYPRIVIKGKITTEELIKKIAVRTTFDTAELLAAVKLLSESLAYYVSEGYRVELGDIGYFTASLKSRPVMNKKEIRSSSIHFNGVNFRAKTSFKKEIRGELVRAGSGFRKSSNLPLETRKMRMERYVKEHSFITRIKYSELTGLLKGLALKDLNQWVEEGYLQKEGAKAGRIYIKGRNFPAG